VADVDLTGVLLDGRYKVHEKIASGAMGVVYRGERAKLGRGVAIKFLHASLADEPARRQRFEIEARAMARLDHPHCATVIDVGMHKGAPYLVMDYIPGTNLRDLLDDGALELARAISLMRQILAGLGHAHELGIFHRDIKPANVMLTERTGLGEQVRILDFGLARLRESSSGLTAGMVIGTPAYMAPEQCTGGTIDARTDIYACGILLFEMLTGRKPFVADDPIEILKLQIGSPPPRLDSFVVGTSFGALEDVIATALAKAPDDRYGSAVDFAAALEAAARPPPPPPEPVRHVPALLSEGVAKVAKVATAARLPSRKVMIAAIAGAAILLIGIIARLAA
jgi:serine/threonine-protein kinase